MSRVSTWVKLPDGTEMHVIGDKRPTQKDLGKLVEVANLLSEHIRQRNSEVRTMDKGFYWVIGPPSRHYTQDECRLRPVEVDGDGTVYEIGTEVADDVETMLANGCIFKEIELPSPL